MMISNATSPFLSSQYTRVCQDDGSFALKENQETTNKKEQKSQG